MLRSSAVSILAVLAGVMIDAVVGPTLLGRWVALHFTAAAVALIALKRGRWAGLAAGWFAGLILASLSSAPLGIYVLSFGCVGFLGGIFRGLSMIGSPTLDAVLVFALLVFEDAVAGLLAWSYLGVHWHPHVGGVLVTVFLMLLFLRRRPFAPRRAEEWVA